MTPKVLVANRSEIACRIFQACREMGLPSVGICVAGDEEARHVTFADEVKTVASYLDIPSVIHAAKAAGATLIHPGYGFLSERPAFAQAVEDAGLVFIGPRAETMALMGDKIAAKELASKENVPTLPWAKVNSSLGIAAAAEAVGYPLLLKAAAGGGGKGMRRVNCVEELVSLAESASAEALAAFGDGTLFLEHWVEAPRHIEVQVFGDGLGGGVHLFERECSLQRRHQKVWEEAPAIRLKETTRQAIYEAALRLLRATRYRNAGTLEFLVDSSETLDSAGLPAKQDKFYFLEMNTRLQVEHPVTELVTGVDLVWAQIAFARNPQVFPIAPPQARGHAIEVRLYAEDAAQGFIPTPGRVEKLRWPTGAGIRIESGIEEGQTIGIQFDSMLGKLIVSGENRTQALARLHFALENTIILGVGTNQNYLRTILEHPQVRAGVVHTEFLEKELGGYSPLPTELDLELLVLLKARGLGQGRVNQERDTAPQYASPWFAFTGRNNAL